MGEDKKQLKIYLLSQNQHTGFDTYDSCVVCAYDIEDAKTITPDGDTLPEEFIRDADYHCFWCAEDTNHVYAKEIGYANENQTRGIICASFKAG